MNRTLSGVLLGYCVGQALALIGQVARIPISLDQLGHDGFGKVLLLGVETSLFTTLGLGVADLARSMTSGQTSPNERLHSARQIQGLLRRTWAAIAIALIGLAIYEVLTASVAALESFPSLGWRLLALVVLCAFLGCVATHFSPYFGILEATGRTAMSHLLKGFAPFCGLALTLGLLLKGMSVETASLAWAAGAIVPPLLARLLVGGREDDRNLSTRLARSSLSVVVAPLLGFFATAMDPFVVAHFLGTGAVADFSIANRVGILVLIAPLAFRPILWNRARINQDSSDQLRGLRTSAKLYGLLALPGGVLLVLGGVTIGRALGATNAGSPYLLYALFAVSALFLSIGMAFQSVIPGSLWESKYAAVLVITSISNILLSVVITSQLGISGPALAGLLSNGVLLAFWVAVSLSRPHSLVPRGSRKLQKR